MKRMTHLFLILLTFLTVSNITTAQETVVINDPLAGSTVGSIRGGTMTSQGYKPGKGWNHILYDVPSQVVNGYIQFEMTGFSDALMQDPDGGGDADNGFFGMYDGRGSSEPIQYFNNFKYNYFRWNFHYRSNINRVKAVIDCANPEPNNLTSTHAWHACGAAESCADKREWYSEPTGSGYSFNAGSWYTVRATWNNKHFSVTINGSTVWSTSGPNDYAPIDFKIWLGAAPGYADKYGNWVPGTTYRNFKVVRYGGSSSSAPVITSSAVTSGTVGQLYSYDVNASGNPTPTYSLTTFPSGMTINSSSGLIQWTPTSTGNFNVAVRASNGVTPNATQSFVINVSQGQQNTAPVITSSAVTSGIVGQLYSYDVNATGNPTPTYSLTTFPSGMTINSSSGLIQWTPTSTGNFNVAVRASNGVTPNATQSFTINVQLNQTTSCPPTMLSYWKLNETSGSVYDDYVGTNNATSTNAPTPVAGRVNGAQQFNGTSNKILAPRISRYDFAANSSFALEAWIKHPVGYYTGEEIIMERKQVDGSLVINLKFNSEAARFLVRSKTGQLFSVEGKKNLYDGNWHHVFAVKDGSLNQLRIYVDGVLENTSAASYTSGFDSPTAGISIGWRNQATDPSYFKGSIDEVAIYNSALDATSIKNHYTNGLQNNGYCQAVLGKIEVGSNDIFSSVENHVNGNTIQLNWETISDLRDGKFEIERSVNSSTGSKDWQKIGEIDLSTSGESRSFSYNDNPNATGKFSYRIKFAKGGEEIYSDQIETEVLPADYVLYQNYPNPFNPSTKIRFAVPLSTKVSIQIYNQLGEIVAQPVNNIYEAGNYEIEVNMSNLASGVYFYKISAGAFSDIKKMMLTK